MAQRHLYVIDIPYAFFGIIVHESMVQEAAPIGRWMIGKRIGAIRKWVESKRGVMRGPIGNEN